MFIWFDAEVSFGHEPSLLFVASFQAENAFLSVSTG
jgi:hypothetical protein